MGIRSTSMAGLRLAALFVIVAVVTCNVEDSTASYRLDDSMSAVMPLNEFVDMGEAVDPAAAIALLMLPRAKLLLLRIRQKMLQTLQRRPREMLRIKHSQKKMRPRHRERRKLPIVI